MNLQALTQHYPGELQGASWEAPRGGSQGLQAGNRGDQQKKKEGRVMARKEGRGENEAMQLGPRNQWKSP